MKKHYKKPETAKFSPQDEKGTFMLRLAVCAALLVLAWSMRMMRPDITEALARGMDAGPDCREVIALFGESVSSKDALKELWNEGVVEVFNELAGIE